MATKKPELTLEILLDILEKSDFACQDSLSFVRSHSCIDNLLRDVRGDYIFIFLCHFPQYFEYCDWSKLDGHNWSNLLRCQPQFFEYCDRSKLNSGSWYRLLRYQPQFSEYCDWSKLSGISWSSLLRYQPQFSEYCDWSKLNATDWSRLLEYQPQFSVYHR